MKWLILLLMFPVICNAEWLALEISFYDNAGKRGCVTCNGRWSVHNRTASGVAPKVGVTAAANHLPFGTRIHIEGIGWRTVQDRLANPKSNRIDVFVSSHSKAKRLGIQWKRVYVERKK